MLTCSLRDLLDSYQQGNHGITAWIYEKGSNHKRGRIIPLPAEDVQKIKEFIEENIKKGFIRLLKSPQTAPIFFIPKKDTTEKRMITDYCYLNKWTVKNNYPLLLINQLLDSVCGCDMFTKMDVCWGYNNIRIREGDEWKCAFVTPFGSYELLVMFFGQCNALVTFQNM